MVWRGDLDLLPHRPSTAESSVVPVPGHHPLALAPNQGSHSTGPLVQIYIFGIGLYRSAVQNAEC